MTNFKSLITSILFYLIYLTGKAQSKNTIVTLENQYQACLDKGQNMLGCSNAYYNQMDSMLNAIYKKLRVACDSSQKENLKDEQLEWLSKRDIYFKKTLASFKKKNSSNLSTTSSAGSQDDEMIMLDNNAAFVKTRVLDLINKKPDYYSADNYKVNPTGFYSLDSKIEDKNGETYGYSGDIKVKALSSSKIVLNLFICKGAPSYNSGELTDTLTIIDNKAIYSNAEYDSSCRIIFSFFRQGVRVEEITDDYNWGCGFGHAVIADGFYKRKSYKIPTDKDLSDD